MKSGVRFISSIIFIFAMTTYAGALENEAVLASDQGLKSEILAAVGDGLKKKTIYSGTLDVYDENLNGVRNLRAVGESDDIVERDGEHFLLADYRDINTGDIVRVEISVVQEDGGFVIENIRIKDVTKFDATEGQADREYADAEIQTFMLEFVRKQTKFTDGIVMLFDKDNEKMRNLRLDELTEEVRRMGIFYSSRAKFVDADSGELLGVDISVQNKNGELGIQALRIRDIHAAPKN